MAGYHPRTRLFTPELFDSVDVQRSLAIHRDRFADASAFTFFLVGSFDPTRCVPLVERYIASLPPQKRGEKAKDVGHPSAHRRRQQDGARRHRAEGAEHDRLLGPVRVQHREPDRDERHARAARTSACARSCARTRAARTARGRRQLQPHPYSNYRVTVSFGSAPERTEELTKEVFS
jgi:zinc protease